MSIRISDLKGFVLKKMDIKKIDRKKCVRWMLAGGFGILLPAVYFYLMECYTHNPLEEVRPWAQFFNILLFELMAWILIFLTGRFRLALRIEAAAAMIYGLANAYVVRFRTNPIVPWDIFSLKTAVSVADNYDFTPDRRMIIVSLVFLGIIAALQFFKTRITRISFWKRLIPVAVLVLVLGAFANTLQQESFQNRHRLYNKLFTPVFMTDVDGLAVTFVMNMAYMSIDKPVGYDADKAAALLESYGSKETTSMDAAGTDIANEEMVGAEGTNGVSEETLPNIIVVMNESFSDLSVLGDFETNTDYMPFLHQLQQGADNTVTGMLNVSVCGGNTANTEFEFLTGNTMAFLPQGSVPYQQYINGEFPSLASHLQELGYETIATHPYYATGWERDTVYPWLGFEDCAFLDEYRMASYVRKYVSDKSCVEKIIDFYEQKEEGKPLFVFNVTMQNHGGYQDVFENFSPDVTVDGVDDISVSQYLSLVKLSDRELEHLITYFSGVDEKTVVVFFGDHQPSDTVAVPILAMNGMSWNSLDEEELKLRYQVPYVIWANYDIEEAQNADTSVNYLGAEVLARAGVPTSAYQNFLLELKEEYSIISPVRTVAAEAGETRVSEERGAMDVYRKLQYYQLFDRRKEEK